MKNVKLKSMKRCGMAAALSGVLAMGFGANVLADSTDDIVNALIAKGVLTEEEGAQLMKGRESEKASVSAKKNSEITASFKDGIVFESGDKANSLQIGGRVQTDYRSFSRSFSDKDKTFTPAGSNTSAGNEADTFDVRRARIEVKGRFNNAYEFLVSTNLTGSNGNTTSTLDQAYLNINWWKEAQFRFGQFKSPMNLEKMMSSNFSDFQERSVVNQLAPNEERGAMIWGIPNAGTTYAFAITNGVGQNSNNNDPRVNGMEYVGRGTVNFAEIMGDKDAVYHVGASASYVELAKANSGTNNLLPNTNSFRTEPRGINFLTLPALANIDGTDNTIQRTRYGLEGAVAQGPFKFQTEWIRNNFEGNASAIQKFDDNVDAWYVEALWLITGENYASAYKDGAFGNIKPKNDFLHPGAWGSGGTGAWEVGARYSRLDANDFSNLATAKGAPIPGGGGTTINLSTSTLEADTWTLGLKWILSANSRFMVDYVRTDFDTPIAINGKFEDSETAVTARAQWNF